MCYIFAELIKKINTVKTLLNKKYISETEEKDLIEGAIKGYVEGVGDEYTEYFTKEESVYEAHKPCISVCGNPSEVRKVVVKIPVK